MLAILLVFLATIAFVSCKTRKFITSPIISTQVVDNKCKGTNCGRIDKFFCIENQKSFIPIHETTNSRYQCFAKKNGTKEDCLTFPTFRKCMTRNVWNKNNKYKQISVLSVANEKILRSILRKDSPTEGFVCWKNMNKSSQHYGKYLQLTVDSASKKAGCVTYEYSPKGEKTCKVFDTTSQCQFSLIDTINLTPKLLEKRIWSCGVLGKYNAAHWCKKAYSYFEASLKK